MDTSNSQQSHLSLESLVDLSENQGTSPPPIIRLDDFNTTLRTSRYASISITCSNSRRDSHDEEPILNALRETKMFPIFGDINLAKFSVNYFLYLEFFHMIIRMLLGLFLFTGVLYVGYIILRNYVPDVEIYNLHLELALALISGLFVIWILKKEYKRLIHHYLLDDTQWNESLFSLLVEGLPNDITKEEIKEFMDPIVTANHVHGKVREVILLQDTYEYACIKNKRRQTKKKLKKIVTNPKKKAEIKTLFKRKEELTKVKKDFQKKLSNFECFKGKAILVFDRIEAQAAVNKFFHPGILMRILSFLFDSCSKKYQLRNQRLYVSEIPEPQDMIFENLDYPKRKRRFRAIFATLASLIVILGVFFLLFNLEFTNTANEVADTLPASDDEENSDSDSEVIGGTFQVDTESGFASYGFAIGIGVLDYLFEKLYLFAKGFLIYSSILESDLHIVNYQIYISFLLFILVSLIPGLGGASYWLSQLIKLCIIHFLRKLITRFVAIFFTDDAFKRVRDTISRGKIKILISFLQKEFLEFEFIEGLAEMIPFVFLAFTFFGVWFYILLPIIIACLYIMAVLDKYRMTRCCELFKSKSPVYTLNAFKIFPVVSHLTLWGGYFVVLLNHLEIIWLILIDPILLVTVGCYVFILIGSLFWWPRTLASKIKRRFLERNRRTQYDAVSHEFVAFYHNLVPGANDKEDGKFTLSAAKVSK